MTSDNEHEQDVISNSVSENTEIVKVRKRRNRHARKTADDYEDGQRRKIYASDCVPCDKGRPLDDSIFQYFESVAEQFQNNIQTMPEEMKEAFVSNIHGEIRGREYRLMTRNSTSNFIEELLKHSSYSQIKSMFLACHKRFYNIMVHHAGSHVMQSLLNYAADIMMHEHVQQLVVPWHVVKNDDDDGDDDVDKDEENENNKIYEQGPDTPMQKLFWNMCQELNPYWLDLIFNAQGSFNVRTILLILSGRVNITKDMVLNKDFNDKKKQVGGLSVDLVEQSRSHLKLLKTVLADIVSVFDNTDNETVSSACYDKSACPSISLLIKTIAERQRKDSHKRTLNLLISKILLWKMKDQGDDSDSDSDSDSEDTADTEMFNLGPGSVKHVEGLMRDPVGSHVLEGIFICAPQIVLKNFIYKHLIGKIVGLAYDKCGNFVIQRLIASIRDINLYNMIYEQLSDKIEDLIKTNRAGIVWQMASVGEHFEVDIQKKIITDIASIFQVVKNSDKTLVPRILTLQTQGDAPVTIKKVQYIGAMIVNSLAKYDPAAAPLLFTSIANLSTLLLRDLMRDPSGARVLEAYLDSKASMKEKSKLCKKMENLFAEAAVVCTSICFVIEKMYMMFPEHRSMIAGDLAKNDRRVTSNRGGAKLYQRIRVDIYKKTYKPWQPEDQTAKKNTLEMFADLIGDGKRKRDDGGDDEDKRKKQKN